MTEMLALREAVDDAVAACASEEDRTILIRHLNNFTRWCVSRREKGQPGATR